MFGQQGDRSGFIRVQDDLSFRVHLEKIDQAITIMETMARNEQTRRPYTNH